MAEGYQFKKSLKSPWQWIGLGLVFLFLASVILPAMSGTLSDHATPSSMCSARNIGLLMFQYSIDHGGKYPTGKSSTEVFQKLIDEKYVNDPGIFYFKMPGKIKATSNKLRPENVSWDVTICDGDMPDETPLVFLTGFKIEYVPDGKATPRVGKPQARVNSEGVAVCYKGNNAMFKKNDGLSDKVVLDFVPYAFDPKGKKFQQLTPDGPVAP